MRLRRINQVLAASLTLLGASAKANAQANPMQAVVEVQCTVIDELSKKTKIPKCKDLKHDKDGWINGRIAWFSNGVHLFDEVGPFYTEKHEERGEVRIFVDGNGNPAQFEAWYMSPATSVFNSPDVTFQLFVAGTKGGEVMVADQAFLPQGASLWAVHSGDTAGLQQQIDNNNNMNNAALAAEIARASAAEAQLNADLAAETASRIATDNALGADLAAEVAARKQGDADGMAYTDAEIAALHAHVDGKIAQETADRIAGDNAEVAARQAAVAGLQAALDTEIADRKAADAAESAARQTADAAEATARMMADAAEATARMNADAAEAAARAAVDMNLGALIIAEAAQRGAADVAFQNAIAALQMGAMMQAARNITINAGVGMAGGGVVNVGVGGAVTLNNTGVTGIVAGNGITINQATGNVTITSTTTPGVCAGAPGGGASCAAAENLGSIGNGAVVQRNGVLPAGGTGEAWYVMNFTRSSSSFFPRIHVFSNGGGNNYKFDVTNDTCSEYAQAASASGYETSSNNGSAGASGGGLTGGASYSITSWDANHNADGNCTQPSGGGCVDHSRDNTVRSGSNVRVRVYSVGGNPSCHGYTIRFGNNAN